MIQLAGDGAFHSGPLTLHDAALFTDLYELTMAAGYFREGLDAEATFSLFVRRLPPDRGFLVAAGLEDVLEYLRSLRFGSEAIARLRTLGHFDSAFLDHLATFRFTGSVRAAAEGTILFPGEPLLEVSAPLIEAQIVETALLNICHLQTLLASKAARSVLAARGRPVIEFGLRRSHGIDAGMKAARSAWIAGAGGTSNVLAADTYGIPASGTMAHSYVTAFPDELAAFRSYAATFPDRAVLLIDTYDTLAGARHAAIVARELAERGHRLAGVRLDSGELAGLSREVRRIVGSAGFGEIQIFASGGLDEFEIERLLADGAEIDAFGVGTNLVVSEDAPSLEMVYKLVRFDGRDVIKLSEQKATWPGAKAVYRRTDADERYQEDVLALAEESPPAGVAALLEPVMRDGVLLRPHPSLEEARARCAAGLQALPDGLRRLRNPDRYRVEPSAALTARRDQLAREVRQPA